MTSDELMAVVAGSGDRFALHAALMLRLKGGPSASEVALCLIRELLDESNRMKEYELRRQQDERLASAGLTPEQVAHFNNEAG